MTSQERPPLTPLERILVIRLDRIGDVVLSTPVLQALREAHPSAFIAMLVRPECRDLVEGNPHLNQVLVYDKAGAHRSVFGAVRMSLGLRAYRFDAAIVLHPTYRSHWIPVLAGIRTRVGFHRKGGWLLTHRLRHTKQEGARHEAQYTLELLHPLGMTGSTPRPFVPVQPAAEERVAKRLAEFGIVPKDRLIVVHPSASGPSKRWMPERFAQVADQLSAECAARICLIAGGRDVPVASQVAVMMRQPACNLAGRLTLAELAALLRRCRLLISNDSGPVHLAAALGTPVVDIFGRCQPGLSQGRWGPLGEGHIILQKDVGCTTCLADKCQIEFRCLTSLTVEEVFQAALTILRRSAALSSSAPPPVRS